MKPEFLSLLKQLIACAPVTNDVNAVNQASGILEEFLKQKGIRVIREVIQGRHTLYASLVPEGKTTDFLFNAHLDVVPLSTEDQRVPRELNGHLLGRGAGDCLGCAVCIAQILCDNPGASAAAIFTTDEETGGSTTAAMLEKGYQATLGAIILDSFREHKIACKEKGVCNIRITAHGHGGHAAHPWECDNALDRLILAYHKLLQVWKNPVQEDNWENSLAATQITTSSTAFNVIPDAATITCNVRYITPEEPQKILQTIRAVTGLEDVEILPDIWPPVVGEENLPLLQKIRAISSEIHGAEITFYRMNGATDARHFAQRQPSLPIVIDGPRHGNIHSSGEWLDLPYTDKLIAVYSRLLQENASPVPHVI